MISNASHKKQRTWLISAALALLVVALAAAFVWQYVASERFIYYWDLGGYSAVTYDLTHLFETNPHAALSLIKNSINQEYNYLYAIPLIPLEMLFGSNRLTFVLGVSVIYLLPLIFVFGAIATRLVPPTYRKPVFWITVFAALLVPNTFTSILRGYPDIGGALLIALAVWIFLIDVELRHVWQIILIGVSLALAALFRRHFAYGSVAFFGAAFLYSLAVFTLRRIKDKKFYWRDWIGFNLRLGITGVISVAVLAVLAWPFLTRVLTNNYNALYASYKTSPLEIISFYWQEFGALPWILAFLGYLLAFLTHKVKANLIAFVLLFGALSLAQWAVSVRTVGVHYSLHFLILMVLGLALLVWSLTTVFESGPRFIVLGLLIGLAGYNFVACLTSYTIAPQIRPALAAYYAPLIRNDYDQVVKLVKDLRDVSPQGPIFVVDSSGWMNFDIISKAEKELYGKDARLNIMVSPQVDSRDFLPLDMLTESEYVVVSSQFEHHLPAEEQKLVQVSFDAFTQNWDFAKDFERLPAQYALEDNSIVSVYRRIRPTSLKVSLQTFAAMKTILDRRPGTQLDWLSLADYPTLPVTQLGDAQFHFHVANGAAPQTDFLYYSDPPAQGQVQGQLTLDNPAACASIQLTLAVAGPDGSFIAKNQATAAPGSAQFSLPVPAAPAANNNLILSVEPIPANPAAACAFTIDWSLKTP